MNIGYRYDFSLNKETKAIDVITYEISELMNSDILSYVLEKYRSKLSAPLIERMEVLKTTLLYMSNSSNGAFVQFTFDEGDVRLLVARLLRELSHAYCKNFTRALWLCRKPAEHKKSYGDLTDKRDLTLEEYTKVLDTYKRGFVVSDLQEDGFLNLYTEIEFNNALVKRGE